MIVSAIVAMDEEGGIGVNNSLPWPHNPKDMKWFRDVTKGKVMIAGWRTAQTLPEVVSTTLGRTLIVWERGQDPKQLLDSINAEEVVIIGGRATYLAFLPYINRFHIGKIEGRYLCDTHMKEFSVWLER